MDQQLIGSMMVSFRNKGFLRVNGGGNGKMNREERDEQIE